MAALSVGNPARAEKPFQELPTSGKNNKKEI